MSLTRGLAHSVVSGTPSPLVSTVTHSMRSRIPSPSKSMPGSPSGQRAPSSQQSQSPSPSVSFGLPSALRYSGGQAAGSSTVAFAGSPQVPAGTPKAWTRSGAACLDQTPPMVAAPKGNGSPSRASDPGLPKPGRGGRGERG